MDNKKTVVVLAPNGRRQIVKVNPNTTILQILEDVCLKQGLKAEEYDIKHHNKSLDTSTIIRFSGLPNNAQLELAPATKTRSEGLVTLGLQLENGTRLTGTYTPDISLWHVLVQLCPEESHPDTNPVVIYMRREIYGKSSLEDTTLKNLGLTNGRAMLRLIHRSPEELHTQANISAPLPSKPVEEKPYIRTYKKVDSPSPEPTLPKHVEQVQPEDQDVPKQSTAPIAKQDNFITKYIKQEKRKQIENLDNTNVKRAVESRTDAEPMDIDVDTSNISISSNKEKTVADEDFVFLGARNAMVFSQEMAQSIPSEDLPDDFFELTINDAKKLLRDIKKQRLELENSPLQTSALRNLQKSKQQLSQLNRYKQAIIRVNFPDYTVLQGTFSPADTVGTIIEFVREYLENPQTDFYLYTTPPKNVLDTDSRLIEIGCVPNAVLHFGVKELGKSEMFLRSDLLNKFTTPSVASLAAAKMRKQAMRLGPPLSADDELAEDLDVNVGASTSSGSHVYEDYPAKTTKEPEKMPKWFKLTK